MEDDRYGPLLATHTEPGLEIDRVFYTVGTNTVTWNGSIAIGGGVTITIVATITAPAGTAISNQATIHYDSSGDGGNASSRLTDAFPCEEL